MARAMSRSILTKSISQFEWLLLFFGLLLLILYFAARIYGLASSREAVEQFWRTQVAKTTREDGVIHPQAGMPDFRLWSEKRMAAYQSTVGGDFPPALAVLKIPSIELEVPIMEGTDDLTLNRAVGHIADTAMPGEAGNIGIAGHRDGFFRGLKDIHAGDIIDLYSDTGNQRFEVDETLIVGPENVSVLGPQQKTTLTLVTCYPFYFVGSAPRRFIVRASLRQLSEQQRSEQSHAVEEKGGKQDHQ